MHTKHIGVVTYHEQFTQLQLPHTARKKRHTVAIHFHAEELAFEYRTAEPVARQPESCIFALPVLDIACQPFWDLVSVSKASKDSGSGSKAEMRLSICSWLVNTSRKSLFSAAMSLCGLQH